jgi:hypothetical protein
MPIRISTPPVTDISLVPIGTAGNYFKWIAPDTLRLIVNSGTAHDWVLAPTTPLYEGMPVGFSSMLHLTYP